MTKGNGVVEEPTFRPARAKDADALRELGEETFRETYGGQMADADLEAYISENYTAEKLQQALDDSRNHFFLVSRGSQELGYAQLRMPSRTTEVSAVHPAELSRLYLARATQGSGLGQRFFRYLISVALENGCDGVWLSVWEKNMRAQNFYRRLGMEVCGEQIFQVGGDPQRDLLFFLSIGS